MSTLKGNLITPQDIYATSTTQGTLLGAEAVTGDGRRFRYVLAGDTLAAGKLYMSPVEITNMQDIDVTALDPDTGAVITSLAIGKTSFKTTLASTQTLTANQLAGGYVCITSGTGAGYQYKIKGNTAATVGTAYGCTVYLEDPIRVAVGVGTAADIDIIVDIYANIVIWGYSSHNGTPVGVAPCIIATTLYGWVQVGGPAVVLIDEGNATVGEQMAASDDTDGAVGLSESTFYPEIGVAMTGASSADYGLVNLHMN